MKLKQEDINTVNDSGFKIIKSQISIEKLSKIMSILSNIYSNPIKSLVREVCSNAVDASTEAKTDKPVLVTIINGENCYFEVEDFGVGISPKIAETKYFNYGDSTKEDNNELIGYYGLGAKSPLAYTHTFNIRTRYNGIEYYYIFTKNEKNLPEGNLIYEKKTKEVNGTFVQVPIKKIDVNNFYYACKTQIVYFPNIYREIKEDTLINRYGYAAYTNDYKILDFGLYKYNTLQPFEQLHILSGNVAYKIDWSNLSKYTTPIAIPIGIKFNIGELTPTPSREDIEYTNKSIEIIENKIKLVLENIQIEYDKQLKSIDSFEEYYNNTAIITTSLEKTINDITYTIPLDKNYINLKFVNLIEFEKINYNPKNIKSSSIDYENSSKRINDTGYTIIQSHLNSVQNPNKIILLKSPSINGGVPNNFKKNLYLNETNSCIKDIPVIKEDKPKLSKYIVKLKLYNEPKKNWRNIITVYQKYQKEFIENKAIDYHNLVIPKAWLDKYKEKIKQKRLDSNVNKLEIVYNELTPGRNKPWIYQFDKLKIENIIKYTKNNIIIYDNNDRKEELLQVHGILIKRINKLKIVTVSNSNTKHFIEVSNWYKLEDFMETHANLLRKLATYHHLKEKFKMINNDLYKNNYLFYINSEIHSNIKNLIIEREKYINSYKADEEVLEAITKNIIERGLLYQNIIDECDKCYNYVNKLSTIQNSVQYIKYNSYSGYSASIITQPTIELKDSSYGILSLFITYCKYNKIKINKDWYLKPEYNKFITLPVEDEKNI